RVYVWLCFEALQYLLQRFGVISYYNAIVIFRPLDVCHIEPSKFDETEACSSEINSLHLIWGIHFSTESVTMKNYFIQPSFENAIQENGSRKVHPRDVSIAKNTINEVCRLVSGLSKISVGKIDLLERVALACIDASQG